ncbi:hypothetical protein G7046_g7057 [Stylonectria norvegica]|nr:hypothetical protein G7046_g7057 [Stylonectria norvegica]
MPHSPETPSFLRRRHPQGPVILRSRIHPPGHDLDGLQCKRFSVPVQLARNDEPFTVHLYFHDSWTNAYEDVDVCLYEELDAMPVAWLLDDEPEVGPRQSARYPGTVELFPGGVGAHPYGRVCRFLLVALAIAVLWLSFSVGPDFGSIIIPSFTRWPSVSKIPTVTPPDVDEEDAYIVPMHRKIRDLLITGPNGEPEAEGYGLQTYDEFIDYLDLKWGPRASLDNSPSNELFLIESISFALHSFTHLSALVLLRPPVSPGPIPPPPGSIPSLRPASSSFPGELVDIPSYLSQFAWAYEVLRTEALKHAHLGGPQKDFVVPLQALFKLRIDERTRKVGETWSKVCRQITDQLYTPLLSEVNLLGQRSQASMTGSEVVKYVHGFLRQSVRVPTWPGFSKASSLNLVTIEMELEPLTQDLDTILKATEELQLLARELHGVIQPEADTTRGTAWATKSQAQLARALSCFNEVSDSFPLLTQFRDNLSLAHLVARDMTQRLRRDYVIADRMLDEEVGFLMGLGSETNSEHFFHRRGSFMVEQLYATFDKAKIAQMWDKMRWLQWQGATQKEIPCLYKADEG